MPRDVTTGGGRQRTGRPCTDQGVRPRAGARCRAGVPQGRRRPRRCSGARRRRPPSESPTGTPIEASAPASRLLTRSALPLAAGIGTSLQRASVLPGAGPPVPRLTVRAAGAPTPRTGRVVPVQRVTAGTPPAAPGGTPTVPGRPPRPAAPRPAAPRRAAIAAAAATTRAARPDVTGRGPRCGPRRTGPPGGGRGRTGGPDPSASGRPGVPPTAPLQRSTSRPGPRPAPSVPPEPSGLAGADAPAVAAGPQPPPLPPAATDPAPRRAQPAVQRALGSSESGRRRPPTRCRTRRRRRARPAMPRRRRRPCRGHAAPAAPARRSRGSGAAGRRRGRAATRRWRSGCSRRCCGCSAPSCSSTGSAAVSARTDGESALSADGFDVTKEE